MDIHFVSTLTPEDEARYAPLVLAAVKALLDATPISYAVRIATTNGLVFQHTKTEEADTLEEPSGPPRLVTGLRRASA